MNKNFESIIQSPIMKLASENQAQLDSLSAATESIIGLSKVAEGLDPTKRWASYIDNKDFITRISQNNLVIDNSLTEIMKSLAEPSILGVSLSETIKNNAALIDALEATSLGLKPRTQFILPEGFTSKSQIGDLSGIISKATEALERYDKLSELESFKALKLKNFPSNEVWSQSYHKAFEITEESIAEAENIDAMISDEVSSVDDFNDLSETTQKSLKKVFSEYYDYFIIEVIVSLYLLRESLDKDLDLSSKSFVFVNNIEGSMLFISNYWNQNKVAIINGLITSAIYNTFMWLFFIK